MLSDGDEAFGKLKLHAANGLPFGNLADHRQHVVVEAAESPRGEQHLALCEVTVANGVSGPPDICATVAIVTSQITLLRSEILTDSLNVVCPSAAVVRLDSKTIDIVFDVETSLGPSIFVDSFSRMLKNDLALSTELEERKNGTD